MAKASLIGPAASGVLLFATACSAQKAAPAAPAPAAEFLSFTYDGNDPAFAGRALADDEMWTPILAGFYPDPAAVQVGEDYYIVNSTFCYFPGIPIWHSKDLVNWTQIGNAIDRPGMLDFNGLRLSRGVFAPTISHYDGVFYIANTCVDCGGNFIITATNPAGPWTDPVWIPDVGGIDPSLFRDTDGKLYLMNNDAPEGGSTYDGHRAIWIREIDPETFQPVSEPVMIIDGGARPEDKPIWIEGPHIYKVGDSYLLSAAEGGTAVGHSQVVFRADDVMGPYVPYKENPILTQRDLPEDRPDPVTSVGHADYVQDRSGNWWASFLGVRPYQGDDYNTGRETFLLPVHWKDGWPIILERGKPVPYTQPRPDLPSQAPAPVPTTGNFTLTESFDGGLAPYWITPRIPEEEWHKLSGGSLWIAPRDIGLGDVGQPSFLARRQQHMNAEAVTEVRLDAAGPEAEAGIAAFQNDDFYYALGVSADTNGRRIVRLHKRAGGDMPPNGNIVTEQAVLAPAGEPVRLRIVARGDLYDFYQGAPNSDDWQAVALDQDGTILSTRAAGGFVGAVLGMYARSE